MPDFHTFDGARLHYDDSGGGAPAILCLSGLTRNGSDFDYVAPHLAGQRLIRMDYRGRGRSDWTGPDTYTVPVEARDALALLDHLQLASVAILGTSRGGLIGMTLAALAKPRLTGLCLVDIGPVIEPEGLRAIAGYVGRNPSQKTHAEAAEMRASLMAGFAGVPRARWEAEVRKHYVETPEGLAINYDPALAQAFGGAPQPAPDLWPLFDALDGLPLAVIRGANSDLLSRATVAEMARRRPDMIVAEVPDRGHVPFLDEPEALAALHDWTRRLP